MMTTTDECVFVVYKDELIVPANKAEEIKSVMDLTGVEGKSFKYWAHGGNHQVWVLRAEYIRRSSGANDALISALAVLSAMQGPITYMFWDFLHPDNTTIDSIIGTITRNGNEIHDSGQTRIIFNKLNQHLNLGEQ